MTRWLSVHHMTAIDLGHPALVDAAADCGCQSVAIFTYCPPVLPVALPVLDAADARAFADRLARRGMALLNVEYFPIFADTDLESFRAGLDLGARLGARQATTHLFEEPDRQVERFAALCNMAADHGLDLTLEFTRSSRVASLADAIRVVTEAGRPNARITIDLLQLARTGGTAADLAAADQSRFGTIQISDGPLAAPAPERQRAESLRDRKLPGEGELPLADYLAALPADLPIDVEVPQEPARAAGVSGADRIARAVAATRALLG